jgi:hypothetical protein
MGKHRTQHQKLLALRAELKSGAPIKNRDIRAAFGTDYTIYGVALTEARKENDELKNVERTLAQKDVEAAIKITLMQQARGTNAENKWAERAEELMQELTREEREEMNYWEMGKDFDAVTMDWQANISALPIYKNMRFHKSAAELKRDVLVETVDRVLTEKYGEDFTDIEQASILKQKLRALNSAD